jgi:molybdenum cofactor cytidylyltransferase
MALSDPPAKPPFDPDRSPRVAGIVLAAGTSSRFGEGSKLLAPVEGTPLVRRAVEPLCEILPEVVVVLGHEADAVREALCDRPITFVENESYRDGQASSVRRGIEAVGERVDGALFALGDMPDVRPATVAMLVDAFGAGVGDPVVAGFEGRRGNPVVFGRAYFDRLAAISGDVGGRAILASAGDTALVATRDPGVLRDVDTPADL